MTNKLFTFATFILGISTFVAMFVKPEAIVPLALATLFAGIGYAASYEDKPK